MSQIIHFWHQFSFLNGKKPPFFVTQNFSDGLKFEVLVKFDAKNGLFDSFPFKNLYNDVLCLNGSKVTAALNVFQILNVITCLNIYVHNSSSSFLTTNSNMFSFLIILNTHCMLQWLITLDHLYLKTLYLHHFISYVPQQQKEKVIY